MEKIYRTLLLDLDDTLFDYTGDEKRCISKVLEKHGMLISNDIFELYYSIDDWQLFTMGDINSKTVITDHFRRMLKMLEVKSEKIAVMADEFYEAMINSHRLKYGARKILEYLSEKGYKLYIISNGYSDFQRKRIKDAKIEKFFEGIFISEEIDLRKPGEAFFNYVYNRIPESNLKNVLIIGDAPTTDVLCGINAGVDTCWLNDRGRTCKYKYTYKISKLNELTKIL